jgi:probable O-glycosylation ligase (exosortase A-associated)
VRDLLITLIVFGSLPFILSRPYIGVLVWSWLSYMNPHRLAWGFAYSMPFAQIVAITLLVALVLQSKQVRKPPMYPLVWAWLAFIVWMGITSVFAIYPEWAFDYYVRVIKIQLIIFLTIMLIRTPQQIHALIWVIFLSIGFFGIKGGIFTLATGGGYRVWGPLDSMIADNNHLAVALLMILPLGYYLVLREKHRWIRYALYAAMASITASIIGSYSRGAFLAILAVAAFFWWKSRNRVIIGIVVVAALPALFLAMPQSWHDRMATIGEYQEDGSAMGRINAWHYAVNVANDRIVGAGFEAWTPSTFAIWAPDPDKVHAAHSIYFGVLADNGWIGLAFFVGIFFAAWRLCGRLIRAADGVDDVRWASDLGRMLQVSLIAYAVGGAFLSLSYFDLPWHIVSILVIMRSLLEEQGIEVKPTRRAAKPVSTSAGNAP